MVPESGRIKSEHSHGGAELAEKNSRPGGTSTSTPNYSTANLRKKAIIITSITRTRKLIPVEHVTLRWKQKKTWRNTC